MNGGNHTTVNVSTVTILKVLAVLLLVWFLWSVKEIILLLLISVIISSAMGPLADFLQARHIPRALSVLFVYVVAIGLVALVIALLVPPITTQFKAIAEADFYDKFNSQVGLYRTELNNTGIGRAIENSI